MSEFWWGVLALPIIAASAGVAAIALFGGWKAMDWWLEYRWGQHKAATLPEKRSNGKGFEFWTMPDLGSRKFIASSILTAKTVGHFRLLGGANLVFVRLGKHIDLNAKKTFERALERSLLEVAKESEEA